MSVRLGSHQIAAGVGWTDTDSFLTHFSVRSKRWEGGASKGQHPPKAKSRQSVSRRSQPPWEPSLKALPQARGPFPPRLCSLTADLASVTLPWPSWLHIQETGITARWGGFSQITPHACHAASPLNYNDMTLAF